MGWSMRMGWSIGGGVCVWGVVLGVEYVYNYPEYSNVIPLPWDISSYNIPSFTDHVQCNYNQRHSYF
jgi:hypothetical protein